MTIRRFACIAALLALGACATVDRVEIGNRAIGERLQVVLEGPWNHINVPGLGPAEIWTMEGISVDELKLYPGLKDGTVIHGTQQAGPNAKNFRFASSMKPDEIVALFEGSLTRDGSKFQLVRLEPAQFAGHPGFRFEYVLTRKIDNVVLNGLGYGAVAKGELFAIVYSAPRLTFFARHRDRVEQIARSATLKN